jgi:outer membrane protein OmpA-like peptidoglycan-associated protein
MIKYTLTFCVLIASIFAYGQTNSPYFNTGAVTFNSSAAEIGVYKNPGSKDLLLISGREYGIIKRVGSNDEPFLSYFSVDEKNNVKNFQKKANSKFNEGPLCMTPNGKRVYFTRNDKKTTKTTGKKEIKLYTAEVNAKGKWSNIQLSNMNGRGYSTGHPTISPDGKYIVFVSDMDDGLGGTDLYIASINADGSIGEALNLGPKLNTSGQELFPWFSPEGQLFFASNGLKGLGGFDLWVTEIKNGKDVFTPINLESPINSSSDDIAIVYHMNNKGYFSSNREKNNDDVYSFNQLRPIVFKVIVSGIVTDLNTKDTLRDANLEIKNQKGEVISTLLTDKNGAYSITLEPDQTYTVEVKKDNHKNEQFNLSTDFNTPKVKQNVELENRPNVSYMGTVTDSKSQLALEGVAVTVIDKETKKIILSIITDKTGNFMKAFENLKYGKEQRFEITLEKTDYVSKTLDYSNIPTQTGEISINNQVDLSIGKVEIGADLSTLMAIKEIYFDYGKFDIRPDAAEALDKIVAIMNEYPTMVIELDSHTDCRGTKNANKKLSESRAMASAGYIKTKITTPTRISGVGLGESKLKVNCPCEGAVVSPCSEEEHAKNRRTEFIIKKVK